MLHIITVATESKYYFKYLVESCKKNGVELTVLGFGKKWLGFNWRFKLMLKYLKKLSNNDIVCFVDGYDVICCRNLNKLEEEFIKIKKHKKCKIIVGNDKPNIFTLVTPFFFGKCDNKLLNAGTYIGYVRDLKIILQKIYNLNPHNDADDQILMTKYCSLYPKDIYIDVNSKLFYTIGFPLKNCDTDLIVKNNMVYYKKNNPFFVHANACGYLDNLLKRLGYKLENNKIKIELFKNIVYKIIFYTFAIIKMYFIVFIFLIILFTAPFLLKNS